MYVLDIREAYWTFGPLALVSRESGKFFDIDPAKATVVDVDDEPLRVAVFEAHGWLRLSRIVGSSVKSRYSESWI